MLRYASYAFDGESGLYYCSARYYDPATRQWTTGDPAKADGEESAYQYCGGDPIARFDPNGMFNRLAAVKYAQKWAGRVNRAFYYAGKNEDCTNFISQCLRAGGWKDVGRGQNGDSARVWWHYTRLGARSVRRYFWSLSWVNAGVWNRFATKSHRVQYRGAGMLGFERAVPRDIVQQRRLKSDGTLGSRHHSFICIRRGNGEMYFAQHGGSRPIITLSYLKKEYSGELRVFDVWRPR